jgi:hypothetical protein
MGERDGLRLGVPLLQASQKEDQWYLRLLARRGMVLYVVLQAFYGIVRNGLFLG